MINYIRNSCIISLLTVLILAVSGCANKGVSPPPELAAEQKAQDVASREKTVMDNYNALLQKADITLPEIIKYMDENIAAVSQFNASTMVIGLDKAQKDKLPKQQEKFGNSEAVQKALTKIYWSGLTEQSINSVESKEAKDLIIEAQSSGFKIETAEGMYFPVIDYAAYKKYRHAVTQDIAAYIDIMAVESDNTPIKDAALMISWNEILKRALTQEQFIKNYESSVKVEDVRQLLKRYTVFALYGANNTPLFSYDTKQMAPEAKKTYAETVFDVNNGSFSKMGIHSA